jgi:predicted nicotinamide N-methyase
MQNRAVIQNVDAQMTERDLCSLLQCTVEQSSLAEKGLVAAVRWVRFVPLPVIGDEVRLASDEDKAGFTVVGLHFDAALLQCSGGDTQFVWMDSIQPVTRTAVVEYKLENTAERAVGILNGKVAHGRRLRLSMVTEEEDVALMKHLVPLEERAAQHNPIVHDFTFGEGLPVDVSLETDSSSSGTGGVLWDAALFLAEWLHCNRAKALYGKTVVELGAGLGLPSLLAAHHAGESCVRVFVRSLPLCLSLTACTLAMLHADRVLLTDFVKETLSLMRVNIVRNKLQESAIACKLDWHSERDLQRITKAYAPTVIIYSDVVYSRECALLLPRVIQQLLPPKGVVYGVLPRRGKRMGIAQFEEAMTAIGLECTHIELGSDMLHGKENRMGCQLTQWRWINAGAELVCVPTP